MLLEYWRVSRGLEGVVGVLEGVSRQIGRL